jgi:hypothetical protein
LSVCVFAQKGPPSAGHIVCAAAQRDAHFPATQAFPAGQALPHFPQFASSLRSVAHVAPHITCAAGHSTRTTASAEASVAVIAGSGPTQASRIPVETKAAPSTSKAPTVFRFIIRTILASLRASA